MSPDSLLHEIRAFRAIRLTDRDNGYLIAAAALGLGADLLGRGLGQEDILMGLHFDDIRADI